MQCFALELPVLADEQGVKGPRWKYLFDPMRQARSSPAQSGQVGAMNRPVFICALLAVMTLVAYIRALHGGFIWDDDDFVTKNLTLRSLHGLYRVWFELGAVLQYYPLVFTTFWVEYHLWGLDPFYFHLANVLLHALAACLLWRVMMRLEVRGAWLVAALFALHPVCVESVAWITERKNVLSAVFYFAAALAYLRFLGNRTARGEDSEGQSRSLGLKQATWVWYVVALLCFVMALLSKTVTCSLPAALLLVVWWKKGRLRLGDVLPVAPFFALGAALGLLTAWMERHYVGAEGAAFALTFLQRCLIAGRALWFYAAKLLWPVPLTFIYPRWQVSTAAWWQWLFPVAALGAVTALWLARRRIGRGPLAGVLFFAGTLFPALGFFNVYPMRFSFVADHFQYLASVGLLALAASGITAGLDDLGNRRLARAAASGLLLLLCGLTWRQCGMYADHETLWATTLTRNPDSFIVHNNLGNLLIRRGQVNEAVGHFQRVIQLQPDYQVGYYNLANVLMQKGETEQAIALYKRAVELAPRYIGAHNNLANALFAQGRTREAMTHYETAMRLDPGSPILCNNVAKVLATSSDASLRDGRTAVELALRAEQLSGGREPMFIATLAAAYAECGQFSAAVSTAQRALDLAARQNNPGLAEFLRRQIVLYQAGQPFHER
jgi:Flp pilus assembly protein TadD